MPHELAAKSLLKLVVKQDNPMGKRTLNLFAKIHSMGDIAITT
jgi:hypothetical protein